MQALGAFLLSIPFTLSWTSSCHAAESQPWKRHTIDQSSEGADGVRLMDVNGDGLMDIATGWEEGGAIRAYLNPGHEKAAEVWPAVTVGEASSPEDAVFVDLDGDGNFDVVSCCEGKTRSVFVHWAPSNPKDYLNPSLWKTEAFPTLEGKESWMFGLPFPTEKGMSLVLGAKGKDAEIGILAPPQDPRNVSGWTWHPLYDAGWIMSLVWEDLDFDGDPDLLFSDRKGENPGVQWLENPGGEDPTSGDWKVHRIGPKDEVMFLDTGDLDGE
ncbi:MAG: VCBS repeat-containing protein, partial [Candidatus Omnitrophica bacterium]|nr:VCBS repeat-containing protein [Candidatus Omnitrophota bacterium]